MAENTANIKPIDWPRKTREERIEHIASIKTPAGGFTKIDLAAIGVSWPPRSGWKINFIMTGEGWDG